MLTIEINETCLNFKFFNRFSQQNQPMIYSALYDNLRSKEILANKMLAEWPCQTEYIL